MKTAILNLSLFFLSACAFSTYAQKPGKTMISGKVISTEKEVVDFATVYLKGTGHGGITNQEGIYHVSAPAGNYTLVVSAVGYKTVEKPVTLLRGQRVRQNITISPETQQLDEVTVVSTGVSRLKRSAFNAVAVDTKELQNTTKNLSDALAKAQFTGFQLNFLLGLRIQLWRIRQPNKNCLRLFVKRSSICKG